jgi:hypothetical protein
MWSKACDLSREGIEDDFLSRYFGAQTCTLASGHLDGTATSSFRAVGADRRDLTKGVFSYPGPPLLLHPDRAIVDEFQFDAYLGLTEIISVTVPRLGQWTRGLPS